MSINRNISKFRGLRRDFTENALSVFLEICYPAFPRYRITTIDWSR